MVQVVALSGGKDSTAMALRLAELEPDQDRVFFITPTGDELPEMTAHWNHLEQLLGCSLHRCNGPTLRQLIEHYRALPSWRMRWCTRKIKIEPCLAYLKSLSRPTLAVGLRADEPMRKGIYGALVEPTYPLRDWGWGLRDVQSYLASKGIAIPRRTDCARCYGQRLSEWWWLWRDHPGVYQDAAEQEEMTGHTFRSDSRDTWPAPLGELRAKFRRGYVPRGTMRQQMLSLKGGNDACRLCSL